MLCNTTHVLCTVGSSWSLVAKDDISSCNSLSQVVIAKSDCENLSATSSSILASPSADFVKGTSDFYLISLLFYGLVVLALGFNMVAKLYRR